MRGIGLFTLGILITIGIKIGILYNTFSELEDLVQKQADFKVLSQEIKDGFNHMTVELREYIEKGDKQNIDNYWKEIDETKRIQRAVESIREIRTTESELLIIDEVTRDLDELILIGKRAIEELKTGDMESGMKIVYGKEYLDLESRIDENINSFNESISKRVKSEIETVRMLIRTIVTVIIGVVIGLAAIAVSLYITNSKNSNKSEDEDIVVISNSFY